MIIDAIPDFGDRILALDGSYGTVEALEVVERAQTMCDLTVAEAHTFAVRDGKRVVKASNVGLLKTSISGKSTSMR